MIFLQILFIIFLYATFGLIHSLLAAYRLKEKTAALYPGFMPYYRISYNFFAVVHLLIVFRLTPDIDIKIYDLPFPGDYIIYALQILALAGILWTIRYFNAKEFLGISQIFRAARNEYKTEELDESPVLMLNGPFRWSRHPLYFFSILFLVFRPYMFLDYLVSLICIIIYFWAGASFEEKRLLKTFGSEYEKYIQTTPKIFPMKFFSRKKR